LRQDHGVRVTIRVRPGAGRTQVGGAYGDALVVTVTPPAVDGRATEAALRALGIAFGVPRSAVRLVSGAAARTKIVDIEGDPAVLASVLSRLRGV
jgi:uncharacterized protein (TIGR00251 family)